MCWFRWIYAPWQMRINDFSAIFDFLVLWGLVKWFESAIFKKNTEGALCSCSELKISVAHDNSAMLISRRAEVDYNFDGLLTLCDTYLFLSGLWSFYFNNLSIAFMVDFVVNSLFVMLYLNYHLIIHDMYYYVLMLYHNWYCIWMLRVPLWAKCIVEISA